jgi:hypothetical protein
MIQLSFTLAISKHLPDIVLDIKLDQQSLFHGVLDQEIKISHDLDDDNPARHVLSMTMSGKTAQDTEINSDGAILQDVVVTMTDVTFDEINIDKLVHQHARYQHDFNGSGPVVQDQFYGTMGCNGTVTFEFSSPVYIWLLENM